MAPSATPKAAAIPMDPSSILVTASTANSASVVVATIKQQSSQQQIQQLSPLHPHNSQSSVQITQQLSTGISIASVNINTNTTANTAATTTTTTSTTQSNTTIAATTTTPPPPTTTKLNNYENVNLYDITPMDYYSMTQTAFSRSKQFRDELWRRRYKKNNHPAAEVYGQPSANIEQILTRNMSQQDLRKLIENQMMESIKLMNCGGRGNHQQNVSPIINTPKSIINRINSSITPTTPLTAQTIVENHQNHQQQNHNQSNNIMRREFLVKFGFRLSNDDDNSTSASGPTVLCSESGVGGVGGNGNEGGSGISKSPFSHLTKDDDSDDNVMTGGGAGNTESPSSIKHFNQQQPLPPRALQKTKIPKHRRRSSIQQMESNGTSPAKITTPIATNSIGTPNSPLATKMLLDSDQENTSDYSTEYYRSKTPNDELVNSNLFLSYSQQQASSPPPPPPAIAALPSPVDPTTINNHNHQNYNNHHQQQQQNHHNEDDYRHQQHKNQQKHNHKQNQHHHHHHNNHHHHRHRQRSGGGGGGGVGGGTTVAPSCSEDDELDEEYDQQQQQQQQQPQQHSTPHSIPHSNNHQPHQTPTPKQQKDDQKDPPSHHRENYNFLDSNLLPNAKRRKKYTKRKLKLTTTEPPKHRNSI